MTQTATPADMAKFLPWAEPAPEREPRYNLAPTDPVLVLTADEWKELRWGLVPFWAKSPKAVGGKFINARLESAPTNKVFAESYQKRRCLIPASGFYEWVDKRPFYIQSDQAPVLALAGLWAGWGKGDERLYSCTVLTRSAAGPLGEIHDRMPVLLPAALQQRWLQEPISPEELLAASVPTRNREVSQYVNSVKNQGPECIRPL